MAGQSIRIAIFGESVLMEGIVICLEENPFFSVECTGSDVAQALNLVNQFQPHVIIFEPGFPIMETMCCQMCHLTNVRLIALDDGCDKVMTMESALIESPSLVDLQEIVADSITCKGLIQVASTNPA
jgi:hypothetical protein